MGEGSGSSSTTAVSDSQLAVWYRLARLIEPGAATYQSATKRGHPRFDAGRLRSSPGHDRSTKPIAEVVLERRDRDGGAEMSKPRTARHVRLQPDSVLARRRRLGAPPPSRRRSAIVAAAIGQSERIRVPVVDPPKRVCGPGSRSPGIVPLGTPQAARSVAWSSGISCLFQTLGPGWRSPMQHATLDAHRASARSSTRGLRSAQPGPSIGRGSQP